ncbi:UDP-N-acetylglucosamine 2-epimerase (non-hydrolyzing) [bacterium]|nr:UDP-N-acetylglucosamine 2-epimerase (non-hydrolyzing) [bacterium]
MRVTGCSEQSNKKKIMFVFGTRPEVSKLAPVIFEARKEPNLETIIVSTGQHREMLDQMLSIFNITPNIDLAIMEERQSLSSVTVKIIERIEPVILTYKPDMVVVQGDTSSAFLASLVSFYNKIPVAHVEAGLRSFDIYNPFPEEANRRFISVISSLNLAPTRKAKENLLKEGIKEESIIVTGNTIVDAVYWIAKDIPEINTDKRLILVTAHRRENWGEPMKELALAIKELVEEFSDIAFIIPLHKNPIVREIFNEILSDVNRVELLEPLDYPSLIKVMKSSYLILTDSGGIQEEAPTFGKPVLVLRETTERPEGIGKGVAKLIGMHKEAIIDNVRKLLTDKTLYTSMSKAGNPYGDGRAGERTIRAIMHFFGMCERPDEFEA